MSSTYKTANLQMHSWIGTDPVVRDDFNENFNKIDAAIGTIRQSYGSCSIYSGSYTGTGATAHSLTFPKKPVLLIIQPDNSSSIRSAIVTEGQRIEGTDGIDIISISGNTITLTKKLNSADKSNNGAGVLYHYAALAPVI